jgi:hypothetical protein
VEVFIVGWLTKFNFFWKKSKSLGLKHSSGRRYRPLGGLNFFHNKTVAMKCSSSSTNWSVIFASITFVEIFHKLFEIE